MKMNFIDAAIYLRSNGVVVKGTDRCGKHGRLYEVYDPASQIPAMFVSTQTIQCLARTTRMREEKGEEYGVPI